MVVVGSTLELANARRCLWVLMVGGQACFGSWWAVGVHGWLWWAFLVAGSLSWVVGDRLWMVRVVVRGHRHRR